MATVTLAHRLSTETVTVLGLPSGDYRVGYTFDTDDATAYRLIRAGYTTIDPDDVDEVNAVLTGAAVTVAPGVWYVDAGRIAVNLGALRNASRIPTYDVYRISRSSSGIYTTALWAPAGVQIPATILTAAEAEASTAPVPIEPLAAPGGTSAAQVQAAVDQAVANSKEVNGGLAGLTSAGKLYETRIPDRLSATTLAAAQTADRSRANHTGTQPASTISDFAAALSALIVSGANVTKTVAETGVITLSATGGGGGDGTGGGGSVPLVDYLDPNDPSVLVVGLNDEDAVIDPLDSSVLILGAGTEGIQRNAGQTTLTPGAVTTVTIPHGLPVTVQGATVQPGNAAARDAPRFFVAADAVNLTLTFASALTAGTAYTWWWVVES